MSIPPYGYRPPRYEPIDDRYTASGSSGSSSTPAGSSDHIYHAPTQPEAATQRMIEAARAGDNDAAFDVGMMHIRGTGGLEESEAQAAHYFRMAGERGHRESQSHLGRMILNAQGGMEKDRHEAAVWFENAAAQGDNQSMYALASFHKHGQAGLAKDEDKYHEWLAQSAAAGYPQAIDEFKQLQNSKDPQKKKKSIFGRRR